MNRFRVGIWLLKNDQSQKGTKYLRQAESVWNNFGAHKKAAHLREEYPHLFIDVAPANALTADRSISEIIDMESVLRSSQAISDEIVLGNLLNKLLKILMENLGAQKGFLLLNILPAQIADELKKTGKSEARSYDNVSVLFTDFADFTQMSQMLTPQELINELHVCFKAFDEITAKHGVEKIKTVGDAYIAVAGLPVPNTDHAESIINVALEIRDFMMERKKQLGDKTFNLRVGIHSGSVISGIVGVKKFAFDIWGDAVNTAARMEQNSEHMKINVSESTYKLTQNKFNFTSRGKRNVKGKGEMEMYFVE